jgi:hypothetical protein
VFRPRFHKRLSTDRQGFSRDLTQVNRQDEFAKPERVKDYTAGIEVEVKIMRTKTSAMLVLASLLGLASCQNGPLETVRKVTYPPDFNYISQDKLKTTMQTFAWYTTLLDNTLRDSASVTGDQRLQAVRILEKMEKLSRDLGGENLTSNHAVVSNNIDRFRQSIIEARKGLLQEPPNYYLVGAVSGYCLDCHIQR